MITPVTLVTGAGGAIGSELVRQTLRQGPRRLVLFDSNEAKLYDIEQEVEALMRSAQGAASMRTYRAKPGCWRRQ